MSWLCPSSGRAPGPAPVSGTDRVPCPGDGMRASAYGPAGCDLTVSSALGGNWGFPHLYIGCVRVRRDVILISRHERIYVALCP